VPLSPIRAEDHCYHMFFWAFTEKQACTYSFPQ
jgi:hypothetical protein